MTVLLWNQMFTELIGCELILLQLLEKTYFLKAIVANFFESQKFFLIVFFVIEKKYKVWYVSVIWASLFNP